MSDHTPGPWMVATSNSWRRIVSQRMTPVCEPIVQNDGHPDLHFRNGGPDGVDARLLVAGPVLANELAKCIGALRGIADGMEKQGQTPKTVEMLRNVALDAMRELAKATGGER